MAPIIPEVITKGMTVVLSRKAAKRNHTTKRRVGVITGILKEETKGDDEPQEVFTVNILEPHIGECTCTNKKMHRINRTTGDNVCTDKFGEYRHGHVQPDRMKTVSLRRDDFWKIQEFPEAE